MQESSGLVKLIYSEANVDTLDVGMRLVEDPSKLTKSASTVFDCDYSELVPDKDHVGLHLVALGDFEHYGANRNGDSFPKQACIDHHASFVKNGHLYRHHRNKDPEKSLGSIVKSAYNADMGRIELFIHANTKKAADELHRLETEGDIPYSMACRVAFDRCSVCGTLRKSSRDPNQCEHIKTSLGKVAEDGKVICTHNDQPNFFDISFVTRPADRIAWHLKAASGEIIDSVKLAEAEGVWVPDHMAIASENAQVKLDLLHKLANAERQYWNLIDKRASTASERYTWELRKAAAARLSDEVIDELRKYEPQDVLHKLAKHSVILDAESFFKYAMGLDYGEIAPFIPAVIKSVNGVYTRLEKAAECQSVCNDTTFDILIAAHQARSVGPGFSVKVALDATFAGTPMEQRIIDATINNREIALDRSDEIESNGNLTVNTLAAKYAAYKLSAIKAAISLNKDTDTDALVAVAAAQNLIRL